MDPHRSRTAETSAVASVPSSPSDLKSEAVQYQLEALSERWQIYLAIIYTFTAITSFLLNAMTVIVLARCRRSELRKYLINLSMSDLLMSLLSIPFTYTEYMLGRWIFPAFLCPVVRFVVTLSVFVSVATMTVIGVNRHIAIMHPLQRKSRNGFRRVKKNHVICAIWLLGSALSLPEYLMHNVASFYYDDKVYFECRSFWSQSTQNSYSIFLYLSTFVIPLSLLSYLYTSIGLKLWRRQMPGNVDANRDLTMQRKRVRTIKMLLVLVVLFAIFWLPLQTFSMVVFLFPELRANIEYQSRAYNIFVGTYFVCHWLSMAHSCLNPLIYCFMNEKFRSDLRNLICARSISLRAHYASNATNTNTTTTNANFATTDSKRVCQRVRYLGICWPNAASEQHRTTKQTLPSKLASSQQSAAERIEPTPEYNIERAVDPISISSAEADAIANADESKNPNTNTNANTNTCHLSEPDERVGRSEPLRLLSSDIDSDDYSDSDELGAKEMLSASGRLKCHSHGQNLVDSEASLRAVGLSSRSKLASLDSNANDANSEADAKKRIRSRRLSSANVWTQKGRRRVDSDAEVKAEAEAESDLCLSQPLAAAKLRRQQNTSIKRMQNTPRELPIESVSSSTSSFSSYLSTASTTRSTKRRRRRKDTVRIQTLRRTFSKAVAGLRSVRASLVLQMQTEVQRNRRETNESTDRSSNNNNNNNNETQIHSFDTSTKCARLGRNDCNSDTNLTCADQTKLQRQPSAKGKDCRQQQQLGCILEQPSAEQTSSDNSFERLNSNAAQLMPKSMQLRCAKTAEEHNSNDCDRYDGVEH